MCTLSSQRKPKWAHLLRRARSQRRLNVPQLRTRELKCRCRKTSLTANGAITWLASQTWRFKQYFSTRDYRDGLFFFQLVNTLTLIITLCQSWQIVLEQPSVIFISLPLASLLSAFGSLSSHPTHCFCCGN